MQNSGGGRGIRVEAASSLGEAVGERVSFSPGTDAQGANEGASLADLPLDPIDRHRAVLKSIEAHRKAGDLVRRSRLWLSENELVEGYARPVAQECVA